MKIFSIIILSTLFLSLSAYAYQIVPRVNTFQVAPNPYQAAPYQVAPSNTYTNNHAYHVQQADNRLRDYQSTMPRRVIIVPHSPYRGLNRRIGN